MNRFKLLTITFLIFFTSGFIFGKITILAPKAPPSLPLLKAALSNDTIEVVLYNDVLTEVLPGLLKGQNVLAIIPSNLAVKLYNKGQGIQLLGVTSLGLLSVVTTETNIFHLSDLNGKTISIGEPGTSPDVIARTLFNTLLVKPVIESSTSPEIARFFIAGKVKTAVLPEPMATLVLNANTNSRRVSELYMDWKKAFPETRGIPQTAIAAPSAFVSSNSNEIKAFLKAYQDAVSWVQANPKDASILGKTGLGLDIPAPVIEKSILKMNLTFITGKNAIPELTRYFDILNINDPESIGGKQPDAGFFYGE